VKQAKRGEKIFRITKVARWWLPLGMHVQSKQSTMHT
jgi:hypothetical protein